jgi:TPR repeat protein
MVKESIGGLLTVILLVDSLAVFAVGRDLSAELAAADELLQAEEYERAFAEYSRFADDNSLAQFNLGLFEYYGWGRHVDRVAACHHFEAASVGEIPMAQQFLAQCYQLGVHAPASISTAEQWYRRAAENGLPTANYWWGRMLIDGTSGTRNLREGVRRCELAAGAGAIEAQLYLARNYLGGELFGPDRQRALYWYEQAARANNAEALYQSGILMQEGLRVGVGRGDVLYALESSAEQGYQAAYLPTAEMYYSAHPDGDTNMPTAENLAKSYLWLQATVRTTESPEERLRAEHMLKSVMEIIPATWLPDLDQAVDAHLEKFSDQSMR